MYLVEVKSLYASGSLWRIDLVNASQTRGFGELP